jgi:hypothetical protein
MLQGRPREAKGGYGTFRAIAITAEVMLRRQAAALPTRA